MALEIAGHIMFDIVAGILLGMTYALICLAFEAWPGRSKRSSKTKSY